MALIAEGGSTIAGQLLWLFVRWHGTYAQSQQSWLLSISTLVEILHDRDSIARSSSIE
jgi:hypothetical protein